MEEMTMKLSLGELYQLVGDNKGISFNYEALPGVTVTIGFTTNDEEGFTYDEDEPEDDEGNGTDGDGSGGKLH